MHISRLESVPLRDLWPNEARDFTVWLAENLGVLGETLGMELSLVEQEAAVGVFSADILAEDENGNLVVIENQLERTDHDHLGKLITYLANLNAKAAVWVSPEPRPEHEQAVRWLNELMPPDMAFYQLRLKAFRIGESPPAPMLTVVAGPSTEARQVGTQKKARGETHSLRLEFWRQLLERAIKRTSLHADRSPTTDNWLSAGSGTRGLVFRYRIRMADAQVGCRIRRPGNAAESKQIFDALHAHKEAIDKAFGDRLNWLRKDHIQASNIQYVISGGGLQDRQRWPEIQERMVDAMARLEQALKPEIQQLRLGPL